MVRVETMGLCVSSWESKSAATRNRACPGDREECLLVRFPGWSVPVFGQRRDDWRRDQPVICTFRPHFTGILPEGVKTHTTGIQGG